MPTVRSAEAEIYYESQGEGTPILFAHGAGGNAGIWFEQVAAFSPKFRCVTFDHRTFARSPAAAETVSPVQFRDDALAILDALDIEKAHLVAQSMGGWTCMRLALDVPERVLSLTMSCTPGGLPNPAPTDPVRNLTSADGPGSQGVLATMAPVTAADPVRMQLYQTINAFNTRFSMTHLASLGASEHAVSLESLSAIEVPVLFISGEFDPLFPSAQLASYVPHFPDARIEVVKDAGHSPYFEQPGVFNGLLAGFLDRGNG
jgi:2-succinyl-6-hydroxy-2,4-cyclohexadiene-1-carboxylate synthase